MPAVWMNNAAGSFPKAPGVVEAVRDALSAPPREPGRHAGDDDGANPFEESRRLLASLFGVPDPERVILLPSATIALNTAVHGCAPHGGRVVTSALEHNSVLRPARLYSKGMGSELEILNPGPEGVITPEIVGGALAAGTAAVVLTHGSNVTGAVQPVEAVAEVCAERGVPLIVDAAQTAGCVRLDAGALPGRVFVAFAGHKGLLGPPGVGGLLVPDDEMAPLLVGGTGHKSESLTQPPGLPIRYEAGTPNTPGVAGLAAALRYIDERGIESLGEAKALLVRELLSSLPRIPGIKLTPSPSRDARVGIVSFVHDSWAPTELAHLLRESFGVETRGGLHCAPLVHEIQGTAPAGCVRLSVGPFNTLDQVGMLIEALSAIKGM